MIPNGKPADNLVNNPALKAGNIDASNWGGGQRSPILVTKTMLVEGSADLRFIDKKTGAEIYDMPLGAPMTGGSITYLVNGRQFLVAVVNGTGGNGAELVGLAVGQPGGGGRGGALVAAAGQVVVRAAVAVAAQRLPLSLRTSPSFHPSRFGDGFHANESVLIQRGGELPQVRTGARIPP